MNMKNVVKRSVIAIVGCLVFLQFFRTTKNQDATITADDITRKFEVPANVAITLKKACYDCHSNYTKYPWYNNIQPVSWWVNEHVTDGKRHLNFSEFGKYTAKKQSKKFNEIAGELGEGEMPLASYTWQHSEAKLSAEEKSALIAWANAMEAQIAPIVPQAAQ